LSRNIEARTTDKARLFRDGNLEKGGLQCIETCLPVGPWCADRATQRRDYRLNRLHATRCTSPSGDTAANDQDQLCRYGDFEYRYNARGQLEERERVSDGAVTGYTYDGLGRLKKVVTEAGLEVHYVHDALGRRIGKVVDGQLDRGWLYADALNPIAQLDENGDVEATFVYGTRAHVPDAMAMVDGTVYRVITDHLGSVRFVVNAADGTVVQRLDYDAFGRVLNDTNPGFQPFGFAGGLCIASAELGYKRALS
jgi:YD repeat-containing protein